MKAGYAKSRFSAITHSLPNSFARIRLLLISETFSTPFELRLLNGMNPPVPEVTVLIQSITKDHRAGEYRLHIERVLNYKHWDQRRRKPKW
jgi:hypothetical protein